MGSGRETSVPVGPPPSMVCLLPFAPLFGLGPFPFSPSSHPNPLLTPCLWHIVSHLSSFLFILSWGFSCPFYLFLVSHLLSEKSRTVRTGPALWVPLPFSWGISSPFFRCTMSIFSFRLDCLSLVYATSPLRPCMAAKATEDSGGLPLTWQTLRHLLSYQLVLPNALSRAGVQPCTGERGLSSGWGGVGRGQEHQSKDRMEEEKRERLECLQVGY